MAISAGLLYAFPVMASDPSHGVEHGGGATIPHMDASTFASQLFWLTICFVLLYTIMAKFALPQIHGILEHRHYTVQNNLEKAAKLRDEAEDIQIAYDKALRQAENHAQEFLNSSIDEVTEKNAVELSKAMDSIAEKIQKAETSIAKKRDEMSKDADKIATDIATALTEKVLEIQHLDTNKTKKRA